MLLHTRRTAQPNRLLLATMESWYDYGYVSARYRLQVDSGCPLALRVLGGDAMRSNQLGSFVSNLVSRIKGAKE